MFVESLLMSHNNKKGWFTEDMLCLGVALYMSHSTVYVDEYIASSKRHCFCFALFFFLFFLDV